MKTSFRTLGAGGLALTALLLSWQTAFPQEKNDPPEDGITVLDRGPVHEAYAQPSKKDPGPTPVVPKKPPEPIPEQPPDEKPKGENVQWLPGYWSWDADKKDFVWVSGFWRKPPPGRKWVPGYWTQAENGGRWVPGYWGAETEDTPEYLPQPPASVENGPSIPAPDDQSSYVPGSWMYRSSQYRWRPGFWGTANDDRVWNPSYYTWTPAGCIYVDGYWDYPLFDRGLLFAPVSFNRPLFAAPSFFFCFASVGSGRTLRSG